MLAIPTDARLRFVRFSPYLKGSGPTFALRTWDAYRQEYGKSILGYRLTMLRPSKEIGDSPKEIVLFEGEDFGCSPMHAIDSDATIEGIMGFLTLKPGDTDEEYFAQYNQEQLDFCAQHAEALSCEVQARYCDENGNLKK